MDPRRRVLSAEHRRPVVMTVQRAGDVVQSTVIAELGIALTYVQTLPDGQILLVAAACPYFRDRGAHWHAAVVDASGAAVRFGVLGDGISHVQTTPSGHVWVGYGDEGIYGNRGWGPPDGPTPIGSGGLNRFTEDLTLDWRFEADDDGPVEPISHCYALNVDGEDAWACTYTDFDVVRVRDGVIRSWTSGTVGPAALAVNDDRIVLFGGYESDRHRLVLARFGETTLEPVRSYRTTLPAAAPIPANADIAGRGPTLHAFTDTNWYQLSTDELT